jgi:DNA processing protein
MPEIRDWLAFVHCHGMGPATVYKLLQGFDSPEAILSASNSQLANAGLSAKKISALREVDQAGIDQDINWCNGSDDRHIIPFYTDEYPPMLRQIADPPLVLYVRGDLDVLHTPQLAIVGSRKPGSSAARHATQMASQLCHYGLTICSGLAVGVDTCAHQGALQANGLTVAVTATGLDRVYPASNQALAREIVKTGAIVSEFPIGTTPKPAYFPRRNRIISGLCYGTLVVEAALKSGTLTTAAHATEQSREVFAIPGSIDNPQSHGCHALIRNGATLVESVDDILVQIAPLLPSADQLLPGKATDSIGTGTNNAPETHTAEKSLAADPQPAATNKKEMVPATRTSTSTSKKSAASASKKAHDQQPRTAPDTPELNQKSKGALSADMQKTLDAFDYTPLALDAIVDATGFDIVTVTNLAFDLELNGDIEAVAGGKYIKT